MTNATWVAQIPVKMLGIETGDPKKDMLVFLIVLIMIIVGLIFLFNMIKDKKR